MPLGLVLEKPSFPSDPEFNHFLLLCFLFVCFFLSVTAPQFHRPQSDQRKTRRFLTL